MLIENIFDRQLNINETSVFEYKKKIISSCFKESEFLYKKKSEVCSNYVTALKFSKSGNLMVSGDNLDLICWNLDQNDFFPITNRKLDKTYGCSINSLVFSEDSSKVYSGGDDCYYEDDYFLFINDISTGLITNKVYAYNKIIDISNCPSNSNLVSFASGNKNIYLHDSRNLNLSEIKKEKLNFKTELRSIQYHPLKDHLLLINNCSANGIYILDLRNHELVFNYYLPYSNKYGADYAKFNKNGTQILATRRRLNLLLYNENDSFPIYEFNEFGYHNYQTLKSCCFAGPNDEYVVTGSDNFDVYMWEIPKTKNNKTENNVIENVNSANFVLKGHNSIVNGVDYNYQKSVLASFGQENEIMFWSPFSFCGELKSEVYSNDISHERKIKYCDIFSNYKDNGLIEYFLYQDFYDCSTNDSFNSYDGDYEYIDQEYKKSLNIEFIKSNIFSYKIEGKTINFSLSKKMKEFTQKDFKNTTGVFNMKQLNLLLEAKKVFQVKNFYENSVFYLKNELDITKKMKKLISYLNEDEYTADKFRKINHLNKERLILKSMVYDLLVIVKQNKDLYESSFNFMKKLFEAIGTERLDLYKSILVDNVFLQDNIIKNYKKLCFKKNRIFFKKRELSFDIEKIDIQNRSLNNKKSIDEKIELENEESYSEQTSFENKNLKFCLASEENDLYDQYSEKNLLALKNNLEFKKEFKKIFESLN